MRDNRMLKMTPRVVLSRVPPCDVPQGYASVVPLPAALLGCHFEHPAGSFSSCAATVVLQCVRLNEELADPFDK